MNTSTLVQKLWNFCHTLRDDGVGYGDYLEPLGLDVFWLKDESLGSLDALPPPVLQQEIIEHLEAALAAFKDVALGLPRG